MIKEISRNEILRLGFGIWFCDLFVVWNLCIVHLVAASLRYGTDDESVKIRRAYPRIVCRRKGRPVLHFILSSHLFFFLHRPNFDLNYGDMRAFAPMSPIVLFCAQFHGTIIEAFEREPVAGVPVVASE